MKLVHRVRLLASLVQEIGSEVTTPHAHSLLFLLCNEYLENNIYYDFIPQNYGPVSLQAEEDKKALIKKNLLEKQLNYKPIQNNYRVAIDLDFFEKIAIQKLKNAWGDKGFQDLQKYLKEKHPDFFTLNNAANNIDLAFFTIGYEGLSIDEYLQKLLKNNVRLLCDVRKNAYSQKFGFSKNELQNSLKKIEIEYVHIPELGIKSEMRETLKSYQDYKNLFDFYETEILPQQAQNVSFLIELMHKYRRIAITCFEKNYCECHRSKIADNLDSRTDFNIETQHL